MRILLTGSSGLLGRYLSKIFAETHTVATPSSAEFDVRDYDSCLKYTNKFHPDVLVHCAAIAKFADAESRPYDTIDINIIGTCNMAKICVKNNVRLVYISTSHVFDGVSGNYRSTDKVNPQTKYSKSKVAGEMAAMICRDHLVIRTEFCDEEFPFETAFVDKFSSKEYIDLLAPKIAEKCLGSGVGISHVGGPRRSFYDFGKIRNPRVKPGSVKGLLEQSAIPILIDTSLLCD